MHVLKKRKDYAFRRQFNEKPSIILGCPGVHVLNQRGKLMLLVRAPQKWLPVN